MPKKRSVKRHSVTQPSDPSYKIIPLTYGQNALIDTADYEWLNQWHWYAHWAPCIKSFYALRHDPLDHSKTIPMHSFILGCTGGDEGDHKNHDTLDNRRDNLRKSTASQNRINRRMYSNNTSGFIGVTWHKRIRKWCATISLNGSQTSIGYFSSIEEAVHARDKAAKILHGEFAVLNFP
jgi:hypothetical protein